MPKTRQAARRGCGSGCGVSQEGAGPTSPAPGRGRPCHGVPLTRANLSPRVSAPVVQEPGPSSSALSVFLALFRQEVRQKVAAASPPGQSGAPLVPADLIPSLLADPPSGSPAGVVVLGMPPSSDPANPGMFSHHTPVVLPSQAFGVPGPPVAPGLSLSLSAEPIPARLVRRS
uniref:Uncharacterized protein n=1 Tax=Amphimedon queenslandica TaxID=400682 RepID=A0A1X7VKC7_AMPQE